AEEVPAAALRAGVVATRDRPALPTVASLLADARRVVVLEAGVAPTNVGAIFRWVGAIGADAVLVTPRCTGPFYRRAIRVSMGTVLQVPWTRTGAWPRTRPALADAGFHVAALAVTPDGCPCVAAVAPSDTPDRGR
ncbi:TrmH family RNA methyltransferase, partial [Clavibacter michiganensis]|uniref:TrmH family RNA methyltransferase n=1 Tax=Clavibacter michiganensis TaxID=28447 RepID=UPI00292EEB6F